MPYSNLAYVYEVYDEHYYKYKEQKEELRKAFPETMKRVHWKEYYIQLLELIHTSEHFRAWMEANPMKETYNSKEYFKKKKRMKLREEGVIPKAAHRHKKVFRPFICLKDGVPMDGEYTGLQEAEDGTGIDKGTISAILNGHRSSHRKIYSFKFKEES